MSDLNDITNRLKDLERLVREDIALDKKQQDELPDSGARLDTIYSKLDGIKTDINLMRGEIKLLNEKVTALSQKIGDEEI